MAGREVAFRVWSSGMWESCTGGWSRGVGGVAGDRSTGSG